MARRLRAGVPVRDWWRCGPRDAAAVDEWDAHAAEAVKRVRGVIRHWELWNEPDLSFMYTGTPEPSGP